MLKKFGSFLKPRDNSVIPFNAVLSLRSDKLHYWFGHNLLSEKPELNRVNI